MPAILKARSLVVFRVQLMPAYKNNDTGTWYVKVSIKGEDGKFHSTTKRGFKTKRDALAWENEQKNKEHGVLDKTFESFCNIYFDHLEPRLKQSTFLTKKSIIINHVLPFFGKKKVNEITVKDVMEWQNKLLIQKKEDGTPVYAKSFLKTIHNQLNAILNFAVKYYNLKSNPANAVGNMGTDKEVKTAIWTKEQYMQLREAMMNEPLYYYAFECLYWLGIREGEMLALTAADLDFERREVNINKTFQILKGEHVVTSPKTQKSIRKVKMPEFLCEELKDYIDMTYKSNDEGRLFPVTKSSLTRAFRRGIAEAGLPQIRIHDLRHSHVSLLINLGYSPLAIADRMGHESIHVTYRYAHLFPNMQDNMVGTLNSLMEE